MHGLVKPHHKINFKCLCSSHVLLYNSWFGFLCSYRTAFLVATIGEYKVTFQRIIPRFKFLVFGKLIRLALLLNLMIGEWLRLRWLPRVSTKVTIRSGKTCKRSPSSVVLQSLFLNFTSKVTNIITLIFQVLIVRHRPLSWQQSN